MISSVKINADVVSYKITHYVTHDIRHLSRAMNSWSVEGARSAKFVDCKFFLVYNVQWPWRQCWNHVPSLCYTIFKVRPFIIGLQRLMLVPILFMLTYHLPLCLVGVWWGQGRTILLAVPVQECSVQQRLLTGTHLLYNPTTDSIIVNSPILGIIITILSRIGSCLRFSHFSEFFWFKSATNPRLERKGNWVLWSSVNSII